MISVTDLRKEFPLRRRFGARQEVVRAVDGVTFSVGTGETLALVGESGSGKTTIGRLLVGLLKPTSGAIEFAGVAIHASASALRTMRLGAQMVFQDPFTSLDPQMSLHDIVAEPLRANGRYAEAGGRAYVEDLIARVGIEPAMSVRQPSQLSGGQRQRINIARALALRPRLVVLDEPVSALDVSIQAQILNLLSDLKDDYRVSYLFVSHDLSVVEQMADRVAVLHLGKIVEIGPKEVIFANPRHPYTKALLSARMRPRLDGGAASGRIVLRGEIPSPINPPSGCTFRTRCWKTTPKCSAVEPSLAALADGASFACHFPEPGPAVNHKGLKMSVPVAVLS